MQTLSLNPNVLSRESNNDSFRIRLQAQRRGGGRKKKGSYNGGTARRPSSHHKLINQLEYNQIHLLYLEQLLTG